MLQLRLLLVDVLHRETLLGAIALGRPEVLVRGLRGGERGGVRGSGVREVTWGGPEGDRAGVGGGGWSGPGRRGTPHGTGEREEDSAGSPGMGEISEERGDLRRAGEEAARGARGGPGS